MEQLDLWLKAVGFLRDLISVHSYSEGNKRFAYLSTSSFLEENGYFLNLSEDEVERFTKFVNNNPTCNFKPIAKWLKSKCEKKTLMSNNTHPTRPSQRQEECQKV